MNPESEATVESYATRLLADGWREYRNYEKDKALCFYKQFETPTACGGNADRPGLQIEIALSRRYLGGVWITLELWAECNDGSWLIIQNYSLPQNLDQAIALIPRMLAMWEAVNKL